MTHCPGVTSVAVDEGNRRERDLRLLASSANIQRMMNVVQAQSASLVPYRCASPTPSFINKLNRFSRCSTIVGIALCMHKFTSCRLS